MRMSVVPETVLVEVEELSDMPRRRADRQARLSISAQAHQVWVRKKTRRWYSIAAGTVAGGLAILCESKNRRVGIAQQMFVRYVHIMPHSLSRTHG